VYQRCKSYIAFTWTIKRGAGKSASNHHDALCAHKPNPNAPGSTRTGCYTRNRTGRYLISSGHPLWHAACDPWAEKTATCALTRIIGKSCINPHTITRSISYLRMLHLLTNLPASPDSETRCGNKLRDRRAFQLTSCSGCDLACWRDICTAIHDRIRHPWLY
jgi:hypothetical protein